MGLAPLLQALLDQARAGPMTARTLRSRSGSDGFTPVELLLALSLMVLIAGMTLGSFSFGRRVWEARIERDGAAEADAALSLLRRHLMSAVLVVERRPGAPRTLAFTGRSDVIEYVISEPGHTLPPGLYRVRVRTEPGSDDGKGEASLLVEIEPLRETPESMGPGKAEARRILAEGRHDFRFRYFGAPRPGQQEAWFDEWPGQSRLPRLVEIGLRTAASERAAQRALIPLLDSH